MPLRDLDRTYIYRGRFYGPGAAIDIPDGLERKFTGASEEVPAAVTVKSVAKRVVAMMPPPLTAEAMAAQVAAMMPSAARGETGLQGPKGERGEAGPQGTKGERGETGARGESGAKGDAGTTPAIRRGSVTLSLLNSKAVVFSTPMPSADYQVALTPVSPLHVGMNVSNKTAAGFTINAVSVVSGAVDYIAVGI